MRPESQIRKMLSPYTLISFGVAAGILYFLVSYFKIDLSELLTTIQNTHIGLFTLALTIHYTSFPIRGARWHYLAENGELHGESTKRLPSIRECSLLVFLGWFANSFGWLRIGDAYRAYAFSASSKLGFFNSLGIIIAEKILDITVVLLLLLISFLGIIILRDLVPSTTILLLAIGLTAMALTLLGIMAKFGSKISSRLPVRAYLIFSSFQQGTLNSFQGLRLAIALSVAGWLVETIRLYIVVRSVGYSLSLASSLFVALVSALITTFPLTPGGLGFVETGVVTVLSPWIGQSGALAITIADRSITYLSVLALGSPVFTLRYLWGQRNKSA